MFTTVLVAAFAGLSFVAGQNAPCTRSYTIVEGDFCDSISASQGVSTFQLATLNPGINAGCTNLMPGQQLCLAAPGNDCATTYVVQPDDTCDGITSAHAINATMLVTNNPNIDSQCSNIYIGEVLCVDNGVSAPEPPAGSAVPSIASGFGTATAAPIATVTSDPNADLPFCDEL